jgi:hypothetical protein
MQLNNQENLQTPLNNFFGQNIGNFFNECVVFLVQIHLNLNFFGELD